MSESSSNMVIPKNKTHDIQGGEKKVMKKSLKVIATATLAFSMFASVAMADTTATPTTTTAAAAVKTSANFTDLANVDAALKAKIDALLAKGFMDGKSETSFDITGNMTRAEAAKLVAKIFNLTVGTETTSSFKDVDGTDASIAWSIPFIEAAKKAGIIDGVSDTTFVPKENVTLGQLATLLVKGFGKTADVKVTTPWYQGYLDVAKANGIDLGTDGAKAATRGDLVVGSFAANAVVEAANKPSKYAVAEVKAVGAKKLAVTLNGAVDTAVATFTVTRDGSTATFDAKAVTWDDAKKVATITLDAKLTDGTYAVTIGGVTVDDAKKTASVVATKEKIAKVEILTASETLPVAAKVQIDFKASNQYGEQSDLSASNFTIATGDVVYTTISGKQSFTLNLNGKAKDTKVPVTIIHQDSGVQVNKIFTVGEAPKVAKIELGDLKDPNGNTITSIEAGKSAYLEYTAYDQYGVKLEDAAVLNAPGTGVTVVVPDSSLTNGGFVSSVIGTDAPDLKLTAAANASAKDITVTIYSNYSGQNVAKTVKISTPKVPATIEYGSFTSSLAKGDFNVYLPLVVKDEAGNTLTAQEIADNADKFTIYATGGVANLATNGAVVNGSTISGVTNYIQQTGADKGKIRLSEIVNKGNGNVVVQLKDKPTVQASLALGVGDVRIPERVAISDAANSKILYGATNNIKFKFFDQYNGDAKDKVTDWTTQTTYKVKVEAVSVSGSVYALSGFQVEGQTAVAIKTSAIDATPGRVDLPISQEYALSQVFDKKISLTANSNNDGSAKVVVTLYKKVNGVWTEVDNKERAVEVYSGQDASLTYAVALDKQINNTLFGVAKYYKDLGTAALDTVNEVVDTTSTGTNRLQATKEIKITAKDSAGNSVAIPSDRITAVTTTNAKVAAAAKGVYAAVVGTNAANNTSWYAVGNEAGTATLTVFFTTPTGEKSATVDVTTKADVIAVDSITPAKTAKVIDSTLLSGITAWAAALAEKLTVKDQYGDEFANEGVVATNQKVTEFSDVLNVRYTISNIKYASGTAVAAQDVISINNSTGVITYTDAASVANPAANNLKSFTINFIAPNGKTASIDVSVD